ncbi:MAG TPA: patatin-like phospholipase family protein, partial [Roseomonas sp.]
MNEAGGPPPAPPRKRVSLALQGGGTHGAFTWGVLERLLEEERLEIDGLSGTSAGAINATLVVQGLIEDGAAGAIRTLGTFWRNVATKLLFNPVRSTPFEKAIWGHDLTYSLAYQAFDTMARVLSPYQLNPFPFEWNPLRHALEECIDFDALRGATKAPRLFVSATSVRSGKPRIFTRKEITPDALLASACLPQVFKAVEIDGEPYWDGGYLGNPALWPLYEQGGPPDLLLVMLNPLVREEIPTSTSDIVNRLNE